MDAGVHLPLIDFSGGGFSYRRLAETVDAARACGFGAVSANDHFLFSAPWLDGLTALAAVIERSGEMKLVTTVALLGVPLHSPALLFERTTRNADNAVIEYNTFIHNGGTVIYLVLCVSIATIMSWVEARAKGSACSATRSTSRMPYLWRSPSGWGPQWRPTS